MQLFTEVAAQYLEFAAYARGDSPCFEEWARAVAEDTEVCGWLAGLPPVKQQPNLVFAAARWHGVPAPGPYAALRAALLGDGDSGPLRATIMSRSTQTNEVGRLATLAPVLARIRDEGGRPLSLVEVGASAGLCLYPDRYDYRWGDARLTGSGGPLLECEVSGEPPLPTRHLQVAWRCGIDLHPLQVTDDDAMNWLTTLVWPEQEYRRLRLQQAIAIARADPPTLICGDLLEELGSTVDLAARYGQVVVFHSAVIAYLAPDERARFHAQMTALVDRRACRWISNEGKKVLPGVTATGPPVPNDLATFVLGLDGRAVAWTHGHGRSLTWLGPLGPAR